MKRVTITKFFLALLIVLAVIAGAALAFVMINPNIVGLLSSDGRVTISKDDYEKMSRLYDRFGTADYIWDKLEKDFYTEVNENNLKNYMIKGLVAGLGDVYSGYYTKDEYDDLEISFTGEYEGVGITMVQSDSGYIQVLKVTKDSPAERGGVTEGEYIIKVDGRSYSAENMDQAAANIRGDAGTFVTITFIKDGQEIDRTFIREKLISDTVDYKMLDDNIGYIYLYGFENNTCNDMKEALAALSSADSLVLDMRDNPGGLVNVAQDVADLFMNDATLMYTEDHNGKREYFKTKKGVEWDKPFIVIVNENSASCTEIITAGFKDNKAAIIVGTQTFGKGIIQNLDTLTDGSALKLTQWQYFSPNGTPIHKIGVAPNIVVNLMEEDYDENGNIVFDRQLERAIELLKK